MCYSIKSEPHILGEPRLILDIKQKAVRGKWNIEGKSKNVLYEEAMGNENIPLLDYEPSSLIPDTLHTLIGAQTNNENGFLSLFSFSISCFHIEPTVQKLLQHKQSHPEDFKKANAKYIKFIQSTMNFQRGVAEKTQNPG